MLARVKQDYRSGAVIAFSGREYIRGEWREVPAGFEAEAKSHPLLEVQPSLDEVRSHSPKAPGLGNPAPETPPTVTVETEESPVAEEPPAEETKSAEEDSPSRTPRSRRKRAAGE